MRALPITPISHLSKDGEGCRLEDDRGHVAVQVADDRVDAVQEVGVLAAILWHRQALFNFTRE